MYVRITMSSRLLIVVAIFILLATTWFCTAKIRDKAAHDSCVSCEVSDHVRECAGVGRGDPLCVAAVAVMQDRFESQWTIVPIAGVAATTILFALVLMRFTRRRPFVTPDPEPPPPSDGPFR